MRPKGRIRDYIRLGFRSLKGFGSPDPKYNQLDKNPELILSEDR